MKLLNKDFTYWMRVIHRDLGFLMVGLCVVYGLTGILLNHMNGNDPSFKTTESTIELKKGLNADGITYEWNSIEENPSLKKVFRIDDEHFRLMLDGGVGVYNSVTGVTEYETHELRPVIYWLSKLHYNRVSGWSFMGDFFAVSLLFFALSGLFMVKGKNGMSGKGKWFLLAGVLIPIIYVITSLI